MKVKLKTFKYNGTLKKEFSNVEDAQKFAELMASRFPDMIFEPYIEEGDLRKNRRSKSHTGNFKDTVGELRGNFEDQFWKLFENE
jgi:hypothetical protein